MDAKVLIYLHYKRRQKIVEYRIISNDVTINRSTVAFCLFYFNFVSLFGQISLLVVYILWHNNICRIFNAKSIFIKINSYILNNSVKNKYTVRKHLTLFNLIKQFLL